MMARGPRAWRAGAADHSRRSGASRARVPSASAGNR